jgi:ABC-type dipeptide/oligopeptide/nickel transport system permease component
LGRYAVRRLVLLGPLLFGVSVVVFLIMHLSPGDPAVLMLGQDATPAAVAKLRAELGLADPLPVQYVKWIGRLLSGNFGRSLWTSRPVLDEVLERFVATLILTAASLGISVPLGIAVGVLGAVTRGSLCDAGLTLLAIAGVSLPVFWIGLVLMVTFALNLGWFPALGMTSPAGGTGMDVLHHLVLPAVTLAMPSLAVIARIARASTVEALSREYVRTALAKGLPPRAVMLKHALKNGLIPIVTIVGLQIGQLLGGAVLTETVFAWPGLGTLLVRGILARDFPLVQGAVLFVATLFVAVNLVVDLAYAYIDPRIRHA